MKNLMGTMLVASVVDKETRKNTVIKCNDYATKKDFKKDLVSNGYSVRFIATESTFDEECEKYHQRKEQQARVAKMCWEHDKRVAKKLGVTVKEYRKMVK